MNVNLSIFSGCMALLCFSSVWTISRIACIQCQLVCSAIGRPVSSVATYILDSGFLVNLALQILENALSEESVGRHDVCYVLCCCVVDAAFRVVRLVAEVNVLQKVRWSSRHVKFARERGVVSMSMLMIPAEAIFTRCAERETVHFTCHLRSSR